MIYSVTEIATGEEVYRYSAGAPIAWGGMEFTTHRHDEFVTQPSVQQTPIKFGGRRLLTKLEFRSLFPGEVIKAIDRFEVQFEHAGFLTGAQKDEIRTAIKDYTAASDVNLDDPRWIPGLGLYVALGMMTQEEVTEVLNG